MEEILKSVDCENYFFRKCILIEKMKDVYLDSVLAYNSFETYNCYKGHLEIILNFFDEKYNVLYDIDVTEKYILDFITFQRSKNLSYSTINKRINVFKRMYKYNNSLVDLSKIKTLKEIYTTFDFLEKDELLKFVNYVDNSKLCIQNKLMFFLFLESGVRKKELRYIEIKNIDLENDVILLTVTKTNKPRIVCYNNLTKKYLYDFINVNKNRKYLFDLTNVSISSCFRRVQKKLCLKKLSPYVLRHSYATIIVNNDGNLEMLRQTMGHEKLTTTQRYIHYNKKMISNSYKKFFNF